jgi:phosphoribosylformylglycinamidine synthase II
MPTETQDAAYSAMGLSHAEFEAIKSELGREPNLTELGMFAVLWSEHCSYKSSRKVLSLFSAYKASTEGQGLENAGVVDIGEGIGIVFKVESHNHPSAVEPYEGAATGVGGIIRDVLTMGARPIASLNSLRFGDIEKNADDRRLFDRVVQGIGGYGNCIGVPTVAGEVAFHERYSGNPLVNAMCVGRLDLDKVATAAAAGVGNPVLYLGSATGRDGIHGATFASDVLGEDSDSKRPNVQIGDPFAGKLLIEATLEALATGAIVAIQDMGAAGLTCSTCEMSAKGDVGMEINLDLVPLRDPTMSSYEIMLSESQERMLAVVEAGREEEVIEVFHKWGLPAVAIGKVTGGGEVTVLHRSKVEARVPTHFITDGCPALDLQSTPSEASQEAAMFSAASIPESTDFDTALLSLLSSPTLTSKRWVFEQYDTSVQTQTALAPGAGDAAVLALRGTKKGLAMKIDGNGRWTLADPFVGGQLAVVEAARNVACTGARPAAGTDCLNFGDPNQPHVFWQFSEAVRGMAHAAEALKVPILSGNVSFYNETPLGEVLPTPTVGVVGVLQDTSNKVGLGLSGDRGYLYLLFGEEADYSQHGLGASEYARTVHAIEGGAPQPPQLSTEANIIDALCEAAAEQLIDSAHDISEGGLALAIAEMCIAGNCGANVLIGSSDNYRRHILGPVLENTTIGRDIVGALLDAQQIADPFSFSHRTDARLFGETPGRVVLGVSMDRIKGGASIRLAEIARKLNLFVHCIGSYDQSFQHLQIMSPRASLLRLSLDRLRAAYDGALPSIMEK